MPDRHRSRASGQGVPPPSPLGAILVFSFLNSACTGAVTNGSAFIATSAYNFSTMQNYGLALLQGSTYIAGALAAAPVLSRLGAGKRGAKGGAAIAPRTVLVWLMLAFAALCFIPWVARAVSGPSGDPRADGGGAWAVWLLIALYSPLAGVLWPIIESFLSGGRSGGALRSAVGRFNITWAGALVVVFWAMGPVVKPHPLEIIAVLGFVHLGTALLLLRFHARPGRHIREHHAPHPPVYRDILAVLRILLPTSYLFFSALNPYLPSALRELGVPTGWQTPVAATWLLTRMLTFVVAERWHGWHGRWAAPILGGILVVLGFAATVLSPRIGGHGIGLAVLVGSLALFGVGMGVIYAAALYYAMEVGSAEVRAGGIHEALIGVGYAVGPLCGLGAGAAVGADLVAASHFEVTMLAGVAAISVPVAVYAVSRAVHRAGRSPVAPSPE
jgi:hypothetical protein